jgi:hypothetical protein
MLCYIMLCVYVYIYMTIYIYTLYSHSIRSQRCVYVKKSIQIPRVSGREWASGPLGPLEERTSKVSKQSDEEDRRRGLFDVAARS